MRLALVQLPPPSSVSQALLVGQEACREAHQKGADLVLFPELWSHGYRLPEAESDWPAWKRSALDPEGDFVRSFQDLAAHLGLAIGLTYLEGFAPSPRNSFILIDRHGQAVLRYAKVHTCAFDRERWLTPGDAFSTAVLDMAGGPVTVGAMICFDREFPESARELMLLGAELILVPNACDIEANRRGQLAARAFENMTAIALANYASGAGNGHSLAFDGQAFAYDSVTDGTVTRDHLVIEASEEPGLVFVDLDLAQLRNYRSHEVWGATWRRPAAYFSQRP